MSNISRQEGGYISHRIQGEKRVPLEQLKEALWKSGFKLTITERQDKEWSNRILGICERCGQPVKRKGNRYCSHECYSLDREGQPHPHAGVKRPRLLRKCATCREQFEYQAKEKYRRYCSPECYWDRSYGVR